MQTIVRAMINAAKADGRIDETEISKIIGKLDDDGLTEAEKNFFLAEANKPMDLQGIINEAAGSQELATEVYAASLLAIEVDTPAEQQYMAQLASGLACRRKRWPTSTKPSACASPEPVTSLQTRMRTTGRHLPVGCPHPFLPRPVGGFRGSRRCSGSSRSGGLPLQLALLLGLFLLILSSSFARFSCL